MSRIRGAGLRRTPARVAVLEHLDLATGPKTHAEVCDALTSRGFDRATIYRNLVELADKALVRRVELGDHVWRFEAQRLAPHAHADDHPHFVCTGCGDVACLDDMQVAITPQPGTAMKKPGRRRIGRVTEVVLKGRCHDCG